MPDYVVTHYYRDINQGETLKQYEGTFVDYAAARTAANALLTAAQNLSDAYIYKETLCESTDIAGAAGPNSNVFERISATLNLSGGGRGNLQVPAPVDAVFTGNALDLTAPAWTPYEATLIADWTISDGETIINTVKGKRVFVRSGSTNLPV